VISSVGSAIYSVISSMIQSCGVKSIVLIHMDFMLQ
jgi:hypothetical protein